MALPLLQELPASLANVVALSLSKRPETRYQNGDQFAADLREVLDSLPKNVDAGPQLQKMPALAAANAVHFDKTTLHANPAAIKPGTRLTSTDIEI